MTVVPPAPLDSPWRPDDSPLREAAAPAPSGIRARGATPTLVPALPGAAGRWIGGLSGRGEEELDLEGSIDETSRHLAARAAEDREHGGVVGEDVGGEAPDAVGPRVLGEARLQQAPE